MLRYPSKTGGGRCYVMWHDLMQYSNMTSYLFIAIYIITSCGGQHIALQCASTFAQTTTTAPYLRPQQPVTIVAEYDVASSSRPSALCVEHLSWVALQGFRPVSKHSGHDFKLNCLSSSKEHKALVNQAGRFPIFVSSTEPVDHKIRHRGPTQQPGALRSGIEFSLGPFDAIFSRICPVH